MSPIDRPRRDRRRWTSAQYAYLALALNGLCLLVLLANLMTANAWVGIAVPAAAVFLLLGAVVGFRTRRLRKREAEDR